MPLQKSSDSSYYDSTVLLVLLFGRRADGEHEHENHKAFELFTRYHHFRFITNLNNSRSIIVKSFKMASSKVQKSSSTSKKESLLPETVGDTSRGGRCGCCGRMVLLMLPVFGAAMILSVLYLLLYHHDITIADSSISAALSGYEPYWQILLPLCVGAFTTFIVTISRNIQISVYHRRLKSESNLMRALNFIAAFANIAAYVGFVVLALNRVDDESEDKRNLHLLGAYMYFGLSGLYGFLHMILLYKQKQYPLYCKIVFTLIPIAMVVCSIIFAVEQEEAFQVSQLSVQFKFYIHSIYMPPTYVFLCAPCSLVLTHLYL